MKLEKIKTLIPYQLYKVLEREKIKELRPCQVKAIKNGLFENKNLLVCTPTASGKTLIAELAALKTIAENKGKIIYSVPLKALATEKFKDFKRKYTNLGVRIALSIGDLDSADPYLAKYDLIICSNEKLDSLIRHGAPWLDEVSILIVDEIHLLDSVERGPTLEILITMLRKLIKPQLICLSACVHGDELIQLANGKILPIRDIIEEQFKENKPKRDKNNPNFQYVNPKNPIEIIGLNKNLFLKELKIEKLWKIKNTSSLIKIETHKGKELKITPNSKLLVLKPTGLQWVDVLNLNESDYIATAEKLAYPNFKKIMFLELIKDIPSIYALNMNSFFRKLIRNINPNLNLHQLASYYRLPYSTFYHYLIKRAIPFDFLIELSKKANINIEEHIRKVKKLGGKPIKIPKTINHDFLRFLGMIAGDGYIKKQKCFNKKEVFTFTIKFTNKDPTVIKEYKRLLLKLFGIKPLHSIEKGHPVIIFSSRIIGDLLIKCGLIYGKKAPVIKLSPLISSTGKKEISGFISGLFDCDSNVYVKKNKTGYIRYYSTSNFIIKQLQLLLLRFNISSSITTIFHNRKNPVYKLVISDKESLINFKTEIGFKSQRKQLLLQEIKFKTESRKNLIPNLNNLLKEIRIKANLKINDISKIIKNYYRYERGRNMPPKRVLKKYIAQLGRNKAIKETKEFGLLKKTVFSNIFFEKIKKINITENEDKYVYDFTVKDSNYLVSGIISHNTIGNPKELASWLNASLIIDNWRPVKLYEGIYFKDKIDFYKQKKKESIQRPTKEDAIDLALDTINIKKQALIFVNSKRSAEAQAEKISKEIKNTDLNELSEKILKTLSTPTKQCERLAKCVKRGIAFHHSGLLKPQRDLIEDSFRAGLVKIICATPTLAYGLELPAFRVLLKDLRRYGAFGLKWIPVLEMKQFSGRAGRPSFDNFGEAICTARTENEKKEIYERYIKGKIEDIYSKLAVEPVLRMYLLSLIAINFTRTKEEITNFFRETFWAYQFKDLEKINSKIEKILKRLEKYKFIKSENEKYFATNLGKRISQLYIDPETAWHFINCIKRVKIPKEISFLQAICNTIEMRPLLSVRAKEYEEIQSSLIKDEDSLLETVTEFDFQYETFLNSYKTALMLKDWANEKTEEEILESFKVRPGELNVKLANADWLLYCVKEIATLLGVKKILNEIAKLRVRLKYGIKEELLALVRLKNIGRVRARRLFKNNIKNIRDIKKASFNLLKIILGQKIAENIKKQVGIDIEK